MRLCFSFPSSYVPSRLLPSPSSSSLLFLTRTLLTFPHPFPRHNSAEESARYLTLYKSLERRPPDLIRERVDDSYMAHLTAALTSVRGVNKTDCTTLVSNFGVRPFSSLPLFPFPRRLSSAFALSLIQTPDPPPLSSHRDLQSFSKILLAPPSSLSALPGLGDKKVKRLRDAFSSPFQLGSAGEKKRKREEKEERERRTGEARRRGEGGERELN